jgi:hypothetical protein
MALSLLFYAPGSSESNVLAVHGHVKEPTTWDSGAAKRSMEDHAPSLFVVAASAVEMRLDHHCQHFLWDTEESRTIPRTAVPSHECTYPLCT